MAKSFLQSVTQGSHAGCPREDAQASSPPPKYSYGYYEQPLGQVVNIYDNHKKKDDLAKTDVTTNAVNDNNDPVSKKERKKIYHYELVSNENVIQMITEDKC